MKTKDLLSVLILGICQICGQNSSTLSPLASSRPGAFALMSLVLIRPPGELLAIGGRVQIGIPRFAEGNLAPLPKMSQIARRHMQGLACLITPIRWNPIWKSSNHSRSVVRRSSDHSDIHFWGNENRRSQQT